MIMHETFHGEAGFLVAGDAGLDIVGVDIGP